MPEKPLLLSSAKSAALVPEAFPAWKVWLWRAVVVAGLVVIRVAAADVVTRLAKAALGTEALLNSFGPAAAQSASATTTSATAGPITPARLKVPSLGIDAAVEQVGKKQDGAMAAPKNFKDVGWYALGARPGEFGNAVFAGHVNNALTSAGVFKNLAQIDKGDYITVSDAAGKTLVYRVYSVDLYPTDQAPAASIFAVSGPLQIVLITCEGEWVKDERSFDKRLVVVAKLAP